MEKVKFRAWDKEKQVMIPVRSMLATKDGCVVSSNYLEEDMHYIPDYELMQYIGAEDKDGTEIFEDDILEVKCECGHIQNMPVEFICSRFRVRQQFQHDFSEYHLTDFRSMKVLGNIHQNPELLRDRSLDNFWKEG